jgi:hypothetical protein
MIVYLIYAIPSYSWQVVMVGAEGTEDLTRLIPIYSLVFDSAYAHFLTPIIMIILIQCFSVLLAMFFLRLHKAMKLNRYDYYILKETYVKLSYWSIAKRVLLLGFLTFSVAIFLSTLIPADIVVTPSPSSPGEPSPFYKALSTSSFLLPFMIIFIEPIWLLRDSSILCSLKKEKIRKEKRYLPDIEGIYHYFQSNFSGYVGIGAIFAIIILMADAIGDVRPELGELGDIPGIIFTPFTLSILALPALAFHELRLKSLRIKLVDKLTKKGINSIENVEEILRM